MHFPTHQWISETMVATESHVPPSGGLLPAMCDAELRDLFDTVIV